MEDIWEDSTAKAWVRHVLDDMVPKMADSSLVIQIVPDDGGGDVKFWVELGAAIMYDKPIVAIALGDREVPSKLAKVADEIVRIPYGVSPEASEELMAAMNRVLGR